MSDNLYALSVGVLTVIALCLAGDGLIALADRLRARRDRAEVGK